MPMFIYHYMILNIIVNVSAMGGTDGFLPYYMGDTGSAGQGEPEVFFVFKKPQTVDKSESTVIFHKEKRISMSNI